jgi:hypothetical protein
MSMSNKQIINLDANGKANDGMGAMASGGQIKSIAAYETDFGQDRNNDNRIGIDTGAVFGGKLTCAVLEAATIGFLTA